MDKAEEKQAKSAKTKRRPRRETATSVPEEILPELGPAPLDGATEVPHRPDTAPAEIGSLPGDRYPTPQPEAVRPAKSRRKWKKRRHQQEDEEASKLQQPSDPPPGIVDRATPPDDAGAASSEISDGGPNPPEPEIIDLTIKEESPSPTPIPPARVPGGTLGLMAGWVRFVVFGRWTL